MQYSAILAALSATGALAAPAVNWSKYSDKQDKIPENAMRLTFANKFVATVDPFDATVDTDFALKVIGDTPVDSVALAFGREDINIRCQVRDKDSTPVVMKRAPNTDINFSKGNPWTFKQGATILTELSCGPSFLKTEQATIKDVNVTLTAVGDFQKPDEVQILKKEQDIAFEEPIGEVRTQGQDRRRGGQVFEKVALNLGVDVDNLKLRCQAIGKDNKPVIVQRGENIDFSFGFGFKGPWTFIEGPAEITKVVCDPKFVKMDASGAVKKNKGNNNNGQYKKYEGQQEQDEGMNVESEQDETKPMIVAM